VVDEKGRSVTLTEQGVAHSEKLLGVGNLYDPANIDVLHAVNQALRAHALFRRDVDYLVEQGEVVIIDEFTGRKMPGRRWSDGLHQAVEAKEGVRIERENQTLATVTFQNYFRMYEKLAGMTGTADTEAPEFAQIYDLDVSVIPTNRSLIRVEHPDVIYKTEKEKYRNVVEEIRENHERGQPTLVGTISIENSEKISLLLKRAGIPHEVLNAKHHAREADIVAQAGRLGAVTIATNMAGRGTDILLGGNPEALARSRVREEVEGGWAEADEALREEALEEARSLCAAEHEQVIALGGLHILGTERHEARRIDNQLRGRAGRQGDPGSSRFYLSIEDDLMRRFAGDRLEKVMNFLKLEEDVPIEDRMVTRAISRAQKQVEAQNFSIRKHLLDYDDVMNKQRIEVYRLRAELLGGEEQREYVLGKAGELLDWLIQEQLPEDKDPGDWKVDELESAVLHYYGIDAVKEGLALRELGTEEIREALVGKIEARYRAKEERVGEELMRQHERFVILQIIDTQWKDHLLTMDHLKEGISLRAYGQRDPLMEYKRESFELFGAMKDRIEEEVVRYLMLLEPMTREERAAEEARRRREQEMIFEAASRSKAGEKRKPAQSKAAKVGRNAPCPCGSGKKYKKCHGAAAS
jgi:preprotein translocase subunit SecA